MRKQAFTLVELLVVVGIIAVLVGILLPALSKARKSSRQLQCAAILRQWGQAFHEYAAEYHGLIPHSGDESRNPFGYTDKYCFAFPQRESCYTDALPPLLKKNRWSDYANGEKPTGDIWQCPLAEVLVDGAYGYLPSAHGYHSYAMNMYLNYDFDPTLSTKNLYPSFLNLAKAKTPSETLLMFETTLMPAAGYNQQTVAIACQGGCIVRAQEHSDSPAACATQPATAPSLKIDGELVTPIDFDAAALAKLPHIELNVKDHSGKPTVYRGVPLRTILLNAGVPLGEHRMRGKMLSYYLVAESADGYKVIFALPEFDQEFAERSIILADERDGSPLNGNEGPLRIIAPQETLQARWARMVVALHVHYDQ